MPNATQPTTVEYIDLTPSWSGIMPALIAALENGNDEGRRLARAELMRLAHITDAQNDRIKAENQPKSQT
jgi:hypothetical protein